MYFRMSRFKTNDSQLLLVTWIAITVKWIFLFWKPAVRYSHINEFKWLFFDCLSSLIIYFCTQFESLLFLQIVTIVKTIFILLCVVYVNWANSVDSWNSGAKSSSNGFLWQNDKKNERFRVDRSLRILHTDHANHWMFVYFYTKIISIERTLWSARETWACCHP